jgi:hypothetical protein
MSMLIFSPHFLMKLNELADLLHNLPNLVISEDSWSYIWGSATFTPKLAYKQLQGTCVAHPLFSWLWKSCGRGKHKFFGWLLFCDRLNTRDILKRKKRCWTSTYVFFAHLDKRKWWSICSLIVHLVNGVGSC